MVHFSSDIEKNQVSKKGFSQTLFVGHWNFNNLFVHNFTKVALLKVYLSLQKFDIFCISETYLNSSATVDDGNLQIPGYDLISSGDPYNSKKRGAAIYYKFFLPLKLIVINYLCQSILCELQIGSKIS